jgi:hypothetical protein
MNTYTQLITDLSTQSRGPNKYLKWYLSIMERAQTRTISEYTEKHHIVPDCFYIKRIRKGQIGFLEGTGEHYDNFVKLTPAEHLIAHLLLVKMFNKQFSRYHSVVYSAALLCTTKNNSKKLTNKTYEWIRKQYSINLSERNKKQIKEKTHLFTNSEFQKQRSKKKIEDGTFHLLSGDIQRKTNKRLTESGLHNFQSEQNKKKIGEANKRLASRPLYLEVKQLCEQYSVPKPKGLNRRPDDFLLNFKSLILDKYPI